MHFTRRLQDQSEAVQGARFREQGRHVHVRVGVHQVRGDARGRVRGHVHVRQLLRPQHDGKHDKRVSPSSSHVYEYTQADSVRLDGVKRDHQTDRVDLLSLELERSVQYREAELPSVFGVSRLDQTVKTARWCRETPAEEAARETDVRARRRQAADPRGVRLRVLPEHVDAGNEETRKPSRESLSSSEDETGRRGSGERETSVRPTGLQGQTGDP